MPLIETGAFVIVFILAFTTSLVVTPLAIRLSYCIGAVTTPGGRRHESQPMPRLGGLPIFFGFTIAALAAQFLPVPRQDTYEIIRLTGLVLGGAVIFITGLLDDIFEFGWLPQYIGQIVAAAAAVLFLIFIQFF